MVREVSITISPYRVCKRITATVEIRLYIRIAGWREAMLIHVINKESARRAGFKQAV